MKTFFSKIVSFFKMINQKWNSLMNKIPTPKWHENLKNSEGYKKTIAWLNKYSIIVHIPLSMIMCFALEWMSRHSFVKACGFVGGHFVPFLYNSFIIFVCYSLCYLFVTQTAMRMTVSGLLVMLGIVNCIVLLNRVTPFGFTDMSMIGDLLTMQNTNYFSAQQAAIAMVFIVAYVIFLVKLFVKGARKSYNVKWWIRVPLVIAAFISIPLTTAGLQKADLMASYFGNLQQGYFDYGYVYGFTTSILDRGMSKPKDYNEENVLKIVAEDNEASEKTSLKKDDQPNVIVVLMESFCDVSEVNFIETSEDPVKNFHKLESEYSSGHLTVPVVGAGTCNSEFEVLTGLSCYFLGPGEYPQKTVLKNIDHLESYASIFKSLGYTCHVVHNNGGNFYSRANAFNIMGFDTFQSKEMLDITEYSPMGSWPTDDILIQSSVDAMDSTEGSDFLYTITVGTHGDYPTTDEYSEGNKIQVKCNGKSETELNQWTYYINRLYEMDQFIKNYTEALDERDEDTIVIFFADHLPTIGLTEDDLATGDMYQTKYLVWNNFGMKQDDMDLTTYQLVAEYLDRLGIHDGTLNSYHQRMINSNVKAGSNSYMTDLELLQYDLLYGKNYAYNGSYPYQYGKLTMGIKDIVIDRAYIYDNKLHIYGQNFTKWSKVYVNDEKVDTTYESGQCLTIPLKAIEDGDEVCVNQMGSGDTIFRSSNTYTVTVDPALKAE